MYRLTAICLVLMACASVSSGCGNTHGAGGDGNEQQASASPSAQKMTAVNGQASMGPLREATIEAYALMSDGSFGQVLGSTQTTASGSFSLNVVVPPGSAVAFAARGGVYTDEASGEDVHVTSNVVVDDGGQVTLDGNGLQCWVTDVQQHSQIALTALTTMAAGYAHQGIKTGQKDLGSAIADGKIAVEKFFSDANGTTLIDFDLTTTLPLDLTVEASGSVDAARASYGSVISGLSQLTLQSSPSGAAGLQVLKQLLLMTRQDVSAFASAFADAHAQATSSAALDSNLLASGELNDLAHLAAQIVKALPRAITDFLKSDQAKTKPGGGTTVDAPPSNDSSAEAKVTLIGGAWMNEALRNAAVSCTYLSDTGFVTTKGPPVSTTTGANGAFQLKVIGGGWVRVRVSGGVYTDAVYGSDVTLASNTVLTALLDLSKDVNTSGVSVYVNPVTSWVDYRAQALIGVGGTQIKDAAAAAQSDVADAFGLHTLLPFSQVNPIPLGPAYPQVFASRVQVSLLTGSVAKVLHDASVSSGSYSEAISIIGLDLTDGHLDGKMAGGQAINTSGLGTSYPNLMNGLQAAATATLAADNLSSLAASMGLTVATSF